MWIASSSTSYQFWTGPCTRKLDMHTAVAAAAGKMGEKVLAKLHSGLLVSDKNILNLEARRQLLVDQGNEPISKVRQAMNLCCIFCQYHGQKSWLACLFDYCRMDYRLQQPR